MNVCIFQHILYLSALDELGLAYFSQFAQVDLYFQLFEIGMCEFL